METALWAAIVGACGVVLAALFTFLGVWLQARAARAAVAITQGQAERKDVAEIHVKEIEVEIKGAEFVVSSSVHLLDHYRKACDEYEKQIKELKREHERELGPLRRYADALRTAQDERLFNVGLLVEARREIARQVEAVRRRQATLDAREEEIARRETRINLIESDEGGR